MTEPATPNTTLIAVAAGVTGAGVVFLCSELLSAQTNGRMVAVGVAMAAIAGAWLWGLLRPKKLKAQPPKEQLPKTQPPKPPAPGA